MFQDIQKKKGEQADKVFSDRGSTDNNTHLEHDSAYFRNDIGAKNRNKPVHSQKGTSKVFKEDLPREMLFKLNKVNDPFANLTDTESVKHKTQVNFFKRGSVENSESNLLMPSKHFEADMGSDRPKRQVKKKKKKKGSKQSKQIEQLEKEVENAL